MMRTSEAFRWLGRAWSLASLAFIISFAVGSRGVPSTAEAIGFLFFPVGVAAGLAAAWKWEGFGGFLALASLAAFYGWSLTLHGRPPHGPWFALVAAPGLMFLVALALERTGRGRAA